MNRANSPAFPRPASQASSGNHPSQEGATLREYLAGQALIGVMAANAGGNPDYELVASHAVAMADLTLIALDRVTHEDNAGRILRSSADPFARDPGPTPVTEGKPAKTDQEDPAPKKPEAAKKQAAAAAAAKNGSKTKA